MSKSKVKIPRADDTRPRGSDKPINGCGCRNHVGKFKQSYRDQKHAMSQALRRVRWTGTVRAYKCPRSNRWHLTTKQ